MFKTLKDRWSATAEGIITLAFLSTTPEESLAILGKGIRQYRTAKSRMEVISKKLTEAAIQVMENHNIDELRVSRRTFIRLSRTFKIPSGEKGEKIYESLVDKFGQGVVNNLYSFKDVPTLPVLIRSFDLDEEALANLDPTVQREIARTLGLTLKLDVVDVPKRVKQGKPRAKRSQK